MFKANNQALFQETNVGVVSIRQSEIQYYISVYQSFATQAALFGGFTYGVLQNAGAGSPWVIDLDCFYGLFAAATILAAVHIVLCCLFLQVYGPGLSLYGQSGSMARACEVLRKEQPMIVRSFIFMIFCFVCSTVVLFWTVLDYIAAVVCTVSLCVAVRYWYYYSLRIYAQLAWDLKDQNALGVFATTESSNDNPLTRRLQQTRQQNSSEDIEMGHASSNTTDANVLFEGYLTRRFQTKTSKWERRYFVLTANGYMKSYKDRKEFRDVRHESSSDLRERPIEIDEFTVCFDIAKCNSKEIQDLFQKNEKKFPMIFVSKDASDGRNIIFVCDTSEELNLWNTSMKKIADIVE